jgi:hypothetical protein
LRHPAFRSATRYGVYFAASAALILAYSLYASMWVGYSFTRHIWLAELPALLVFLAAAYFPSSGGLTSKCLAATSPIVLVLLLYTCHDAFYYYVRRLPRFTDLENVPALFRVAGPFISALIVLPLAAAAGGIVVSALVFYWKRPWAKTLRGLCLRAGLLLVLCLFLRSGLFDGYLQKDLEYTPWSEVRNVQRNGRLTTFIYYNNRRHEHIAYLREQARSLSEDPRRWDVGLKRNVHIIILESFIDPRAIKNACFSGDPLANALKRFLPRGDFDHLISPAYGGGTAQAEFEILTGLPAMAKIDSVEFNVFEGYPTYSMCEVLGNYGYACSACVASEPGYYNSRSAYKSLQFQRVDFLNMNRSYLREDNPRDRFLFDGDLLDMNLKYVKRCMLKGRPLFNYVLGMYGHIPYTRDKKRRPDRIKVTTPAGDPCAEDVCNIANQFFYRTRALGEFLESLQRIDPDCIVLVVSDHLPPIFGHGLSYRDNRKGLHENIGFMLDRWRPVPLSKMRYYRLHYVVLSRLTGTPPPPVVDSRQALGRLYYTELARAMGLVPPGRR